MSHEAPTIDLNGCEAVLVRPGALAGIAISKSHGQIQNMPLEQLFATQAAALAICWPPNRKWPGRLRPRPWRTSQRIEDYGAEIFEDLAAGGCGTIAIMEAGVPAYHWVVQNTISAQGVKTSEDFSEAPEGG